MKRYSRNRLGRVLVIAAIAFFLAFLAGCNFSSSSTPGSTILSGVASAGPIASGTISAYQVVNGAKDTLLGTTSTDSNGNYTLNIGSYTGQVLLEVTGGSYKDEATGVSTTLSATLSSIVANASGSTTASVTPISDAVVQNAKTASGGLTSANITTALSAMKSQTGFDPIATLPADPTSETSLTATDAAKAYAAYLGAISQYLKDNAGKTLAQSVTDFAGVIQGAELASSTAIQTAMNNFLASDKNKTGLTQTALQTLTTNLVNIINAGGTPGGGGCTGSCSASGTYTYSTTTGALNLTTTTTTFPGDATGAKPQKTILAISTETMTIQEPAGLTTSWFRSSGTVGNIVGSWSMGNYTIVFNDNGTFSVSVGSDSVVLTYGISGKVTLNGAGLSGVTVSLTGASKTTTTTDVNGNYAFAGALNGSYTVGASLTGYTFTPTSISATVSGANLTGQDFAVTYTISGKVTLGGVGLSGVTVSLTGASTTTTTTDADGNYAFAGALNGSYTLASSRTGYAFSPASSAITVNGANLTGQDFTVVTYTISGKITVNGAALPGVTVSLTGASTTTTTTDANGNYAFAGALNGSYTLATSLAGYDFSPASSAITVNGANLTGQDFTVVTYTISGKITVNGAALPGVTVSRTGASTTSTTTDANGNYAFAGALNGSYTLTTSLAGYTFSSASRSITVSGANLTAQEFTATDNRVAISGTVSAPGGSLAFNQPVGLKRFFAKLFLFTKFFVADAMAENPGTDAVAGVTVNLIEIDSAGAQVGPILATAITDATGKYILKAPEGFDPASKYVVRAEGATKMNAFVTGTDGIDVDPYSDATVTLITGNAGNNIATISLADIDAVTDTVIGFSSNVVTEATTADRLTDDLKAVVLNDEEGNNIVTSQSAPGGIIGTVTDSSGTPLANIRIRVKTFGDQVIQAITRTDTNGQYKVHVPAGDYIVGAFNNTTATMAASEWWTSGGGTPSHKTAEKVTIDATEITRDFVLTAGCRIKGKITALATGAALAGLNVVLVDFDSGIDFMSVRTHADGVYNFNVTPGNYFIAIRNSTLKPYATGLYNSAISGGGPTKTQAEKVTLTSGNAIEINMGLLAGYKIEGTVTDPVSGPVAGVRVRFEDTATGTTVEGMRTDRDGSYRIWVRPGTTYDVFSRGQIAAAVDVTSGNQTRNFNAAVGRITGVLKDANGNPVSQVNVTLFERSGTSPTYTYKYLGKEYSDADGSFTVYTIDPTTSIIVEFKVDDGSMVGSSIYNGKYVRSGGTAVTAPAAGNTTTLNPISLPAGAVLTGIVTKGGQPAHSKSVQVRYGGGNTAGGTYRFVNTSTVFDGSYSISLPAGITFSRVCVFDQPGDTTAPVCTNNVVMDAAGSPTTKNFAY